MTLSEFLNLPLQEPQYLLIGNPVSHSVSPDIHNASLLELKLPGTYSSVQVLPEEIHRIPELLANPFVQGINITLPYKETMVQFADSLDSEAILSGVINTLYRSNGQWIGTNTDILGIESALRPYKERFIDQVALIFGSGGASRAAVIALKRLGFSKIRVVSRNPAAIQDSFMTFPEVEIVEYSQWQSLADQVALFVNSTPLGMWPEIGYSPISSSEAQFLRGKIVFDMVYRPLRTLFLQQAEEAGAQTVDGLAMLLYQANASFEKWTGESFSVDERRKELMSKVDPPLKLVNPSFNNSVSALFTLRNQQVGSFAAYKGLDFGFYTETSPEFKEISWRMLESEAPWTKQRAWVKQVHGGDVVAVDTPGLAGAADALVTTTRGLALTIQVADCIPVLMADQENGVIGASHAGWRGVAAGVVPNTLDQMIQAGAELDQIQVWIGPGISVQHFEVGEEVASQFPESYINRSFSKPHVDLEAVLHAQLIEKGINESQVKVLKGCTFAEEEKFHSYRRDRDFSGRMVAMIVLNP